MKQIKIDLTRFRGNQSTLFTGRPQGLDARNELGLDDIDKQNDIEVLFIVPNGTTSFNPSFYLGLLYHSCENLGVELFNSKYKFQMQTTDEATKKVLEKNLEDGKRNAINEVTKKTGLWQFIKQKNR